MTESCPHCGEVLPAFVDAFCPDCGEDLSDAPAPKPSVSEPPAPKAERKSPYQKQPIALLLVIIGLIIFVINIIVDVLQAVR